MSIKMISLPESPITSIGFKNGEHVIELRLQGSSSVEIGNNDYAVYIELENLDLLILAIQEFKKEVLKDV